MPEHPVLLLVEDEALVSMALEVALMDAGFAVIVASNGNEAVTQLEAGAAGFAGLITDIRLPMVDGWTIARRARELVPHMPVVYISGDSANEWSANGVPDSIVLGKPFAMVQLTTAMANLINEAPNTQMPSEG